MKWPQEIVEAFKQVPFKPKQGETQETVVQYLLDQAAKYATWRSEGDPKNLPDAYSFPYTPLGHLSAMGFGGKVENCTFDEKWCTAVDKLYAYVREQAETILSNFQGKGEAYPDGREDEIE